jgi:hypothetical protein
MTGKQALEAVLKPGGTLVTEDVARAIVEFVAGARGGSAERLAELDVEPALLGVICRELNERRATPQGREILAGWPLAHWQQRRWHENLGRRHRPGDGHVFLQDQRPQPSQRRDQSR